MNPANISAATARDDFLTLLVTQLKHQDPLKPVDQDNFIGQLAEFSTLEGIEGLNASFEAMLQLQQLTQGVDILGKNATYVDGNFGVSKGVIEEVTSVDGALHVIINNELISLGQIQSIGLAPAA